MDVNADNTTSEKNFLKVAALIAKCKQTDRILVCHGFEKGQKDINLARQVVSKCGEL